jgi:DNA adenine methylase
MCSAPVVVRPPFPYYGGKTLLGPAIAALLPAHQHYVEPFAGSLAVLLAKTPTAHETVNDLDGELVTFWRVLRDQPAALARVCALTPHSRAEHHASYTPTGAGIGTGTPAGLGGGRVGEVEVARRVWVQLTQGRAGVRSRTGWRHYVHPAGEFGLPGYLTGYVGRIAAAAERLQRVSLECRPAVEVIAAYGADPAVLLYVDPPYLGSLRHHSGGYRHELRGADEHRDLAAALHACTAAVVLSGYPCELYDRDLYPDWWRTTLPAHTGQGGAWAARTEVLWSNRPLGVDQPALFDLTHPTGGAA